MIGKSIMYVHTYVLYALRVSDGKVQREGDTEFETTVPIQVGLSCSQLACSDTVLPATA